MIITEGVEILKKASDTLEALKKLKTLADHTPVIAELLNAVLTARSIILSQDEEMKAILASKNDLEKEVVRLKGWDTERKRYEKKEVAFHVFAYVLKESLRRGEPSQWLCSNCYDNFEKGGLQLFNESTAKKIYQCERCGGQIHIPTPRKPSKVVNSKGWT